MSTGLQRDCIHVVYVLVLPLSSWRVCIGINWLLVSFWSHVNNLIRSGTLNQWSSRSNGVWSYAFGPPAPCAALPNKPNGQRHSNRILQLLVNLADNDCTKQGMTWNGIVGFNVPIDTLAYRSFRRLYMTWKRTPRRTLLIWQSRETRSDNGSIG